MRLFETARAYAQRKQRKIDAGLKLWETMFDTKESEFMTKLELVKAAVDRIREQEDKKRFINFFVGGASLFMTYDQWKQLIDVSETYIYQKEGDG